MRFPNSFRLALLACIATASASAATPPAAVPAADAVLAPASRAPFAPASTVRIAARGGLLRIRLDEGLLRDLGVLRIDGAVRRASNGVWFDLPLAPDAHVDMDLHGRQVLAFAGGEGALEGRVSLVRRGDAIEWRAARFVLRPGDAPRIDLVGADGDVPFYVDTLMYRLVDGDRRLQVRTADLRATPSLAQRLGNPALAGQPIGEARLLASLEAPLAPVEPDSCAVPNWPGTPVPGVPGETYKADVFMTNFSGATLGSCSGCDGPGGGATGFFKMAPSSSLRNNVNTGAAQPTVAGDPLGTSTALYTAEVPWQEKFSGPNPPYGTDQHPYLIWNVYRIDAAGTLEQVGRSGLKHAFLTTNSGCSEFCGDSAVLGRGCGDTYGTGNNDSDFDLGPRSELDAPTGRWGRCHSIYDPNCDGSPDDFVGYGPFTHRMVLREGDVDASVNPGAMYLFESWYVVRDDIDIYNTMATRPVRFTWTGATWSTINDSPFLLGSALDRWYGTQPAPKTIAAITPAEGHAKVAVRATSLGGGSWRYEFVVMNFDFARSVVQGTAPNLDVVSNHGFRRVTIARASDANVTSTGYADGDGNAANDWTATVGANAITWQAPNAASSLDWGNMVRLTVVADRAPGNGSIDLEPTQAGAPAAYTVAGFSVGTIALFANGFE